VALRHFQEVEVGGQPLLEDHVRQGEPGLDDLESCLVLLGELIGGDGLEGLLAGLDGLLVQFLRLLEGPVAGHHVLGLAGLLDDKVSQLHLLLAGQADALVNPLLDRLALLLQVGLHEGLEAALLQPPVKVIGSSTGRPRQGQPHRREHANRRDNDSAHNDLSVFVRSSVPPLLRRQI